MPDPNLNDEIDALCCTEVAAGFRNDSDIFDLVVASFCGSGSPEEIRSRTEASLALAAAKHAAAETHFPETTDCDRLDQAFAALNSQGILARQNYWCCNNCATEAIRSELVLRPDAIGYTFYHEQATETAVEGYGIYLNYGSSEATNEACCAIGARVVEALRRTGLKPKWDGDIEKKIEVPLKWERRRRFETGDLTLAVTSRDEAPQTWTQQSERANSDQGPILKVARYLGKSAHLLLEAEPFNGWPVERSVEHDLHRPEVHYFLVGSGLQFTCDREGERIRSLFLQPGAGAGTILPEIPFHLSRTKIVSLFGPPSESGKASSHRALGDYGPWDRFQRTDYILHVQYKVGDDSIAMITFMRHDVAP